jgi:hypothetical protein
MSKSAEEIRDDLARQRQKQAVLTVSKNAESGVPVAGQAVRRLSTRQANPPLVLPAAGRSTLPHSVDAEKGVLCAILQRPEVVLPIAQQFLGPDHFYIGEHQALFEAVCSRFNEEGMFDMVTLLTHLIDVGQINSVGGPGYLNDLFDFGAIPENASSYIDILRDKYATRAIIKTAQDSIKRAYEADEIAGGGPAAIFDELFVGLEQARAGLRCNRRLPDLRDLSQFLGESRPEKPPELVRGILHQGSKLIVGGTSKGRKTMALLDLAVSVATGAPWWGFETIQGPVCYINFEIQEAFFCDRTHALCSTKKLELSRGMLMGWNLRGHGDGIENLVADLMPVLRHRKFVLIIVDPIYKALGDRDENKAGDVASMLNQLEKIAVKTGAAVAFGAHYSKGNQSLKESIDRIGGSGVFARDPDSILTMTAHEEEEAFTVEATLRNFPPIKPFVVRWEWPLFYRDDQLNPEALKPARARGRKEKYSPKLLLELLSAIDGAQPKDLCKHLDEQHGISRRNVYYLKDKLIEKGLLIVKDGLWYRGSGKGVQ